MTRIAEPTKKQAAGWKKWVASRPASVRSVAARFDPWSLYRMKSTGQRVTLISFGEQEDGSVTLTVAITPRFNEGMIIAHEVFGIDPDDLEDCN